MLLDIDDDGDPGTLRTSSELSSVQVKLVLAPRPELYDLSADPYETQDVADRHPEQSEQMKARLLGRVEELSADFEAERVDPQTIERLEELGYVQ